MRKNKSWLVFVEGETEQSLINEFKDSESLFIKDVKKFNFWNNDAKSISPLLRSSYSIIIVCDTDDLNNVERFVKNIKHLSKQTKGLYIILQHNNFEDELCYACNCQKNKLFRHFHKRSGTSLSAKEFKANFLSCPNKLQKLLAINFNKSKIWSQVTLSKTVLSRIENFVLDFDELLGKIDRVNR